MEWRSSLSLLFKRLWITRSVQFKHAERFQTPSQSCCCGGWTPADVAIWQLSSRLMLFDWKHWRGLFHLKINPIKFIFCSEQRADLRRILKGNQLNLWLEVFCVICSWFLHLFDSVCSSERSIMLFLKDWGQINLYIRTHQRMGDDDCGQAEAALCWCCCLFHLIISRLNQHDV